MSVWHFKEGMGEKGFSELDIVLNTLAHQTEGFRGAISLLDAENPNSVTILTLWVDKESLERSEKNVFQEALKRVQESLEKPPQIKNYKVFSTELFQRSTWPFRWA
jgi:heme-degrading monooxygenase HmoA